MVVVAEVKIWGERAGAVSWNETTRLATFEFEPRFLTRGLDLAPIKMPLAGALAGTRLYSFPDLRNQTFLGLPGLLADSLPDRFGTALLDRWLAEQGRTIDSVNPIERLCYVGTRGMGALEYHPPMKDLKDKKQEIEIAHLVELASEILRERAEFHANINRMDREDLREIIRVGTSAGGARAKAILAYNRHTGELRSGQIDTPDGFEYWIVKLDGVTNQLLGDPQGYGRIEYAYYLMAKDCGIDMAECKLKSDHDRAHFMTKRFDRDGLDKIHLQSLCGLAHFDYNTPDYSYEQAFQIIRTLGLPYPTSEELFRRMCFNVIARNHDDHTKNISFLMDRSGAWRLSPAYDVTYAFNPDGDWTSAHQMSINGKADQITRSDLTDIAKRMNINKPGLVIDKIADTVADWPRYAKAAGVEPARVIAIRKTHVLL